MKPPELPAPTELVIVRPGSPETAGTRYLGLAEALDRLRGVQLRGKVVTQCWLLPEREAGLDAARARALMAAADHGFGWRPRTGVSPSDNRSQMAPRQNTHTDPPTAGSVPLRKPTIRSTLRFRGV